MKSILSLCLFFITCSALAEVVVLKKGETISSILFEKKYVPIYGKGHFLDQVFKLNGLNEKRAKMLLPGQAVQLPEKEKEKENVAVASEIVPASAVSGPILSKNIETRNSEVAVIFSLGSAFFHFQDQNKKDARLETQLYLKNAFKIQTPITEKISVLGQVDVHYLRFNEPGNVGLNKRDYVSWGFDVGPKFQFNAFSMGLSLGQTPMWSPIASSATTLEMSQFLGHFVKLPVGFQLWDMKSEIYWQRFLTRQTSDLDIEGGDLFGIDLWFYKSKIIWGVEAIHGTRQTNLNDEVFTAIFLKVKLF